MPPPPLASEGSLRQAGLASLARILYGSGMNEHETPTLPMDEEVEMPNARRMPRTRRGRRVGRYFVWQMTGAEGFVGVERTSRWTEYGKFCVSHAQSGTVLHSFETAAEAIGYADDCSTYGPDVETDDPRHLYEIYVSNPRFAAWNARIENVGRYVSWRDFCADIDEPA